MLIDLGLSRAWNSRGEWACAVEQLASTSASTSRLPPQLRFSPVARAAPNCLGERNERMGPDQNALPEELPLLVEEVDPLNLLHVPPRAANAHSFSDREVCNREPFAPQPPAR